MDALDRKIKQLLETRAVVAAPEDGYCPTSEDYYLFLEGRLDGNRLDKMLGYLKTHPEAQRMVVEARKLIADEVGETFPVVPEALIKKVSALMPNAGWVACPHCGKAITPFKKKLQFQKALNLLWLGLAALSLALSFFVRHYFLQFLALAVVFAVKWIVEQKSTKTQILIYRALEQESANSRRDSEHLHRFPSHL